MISDCDVWHAIDPQDLWVYDKLIVAKRLGYQCGPAGVQAPAGTYIVRPCVNFRMMGLGARIVNLTHTNQEQLVPDGHFWCEVFTGRHLSFDFNNGQQVLAVEGFRDSNRLDRFSKWKKVDEVFEVPALLQPIVDKYQWVNLEVIGDKVIEVHLRYNDDFSGHDCDEIIPIWKEDFYDSPAGDRIGFLLDRKGG